MAKVFIEETTLTAIGDAIRDKEGSSELVPVNDMADRISAIQSGGSSEELEKILNIPEGSCSQKFIANQWNTFIETFGNRIKTNRVTNATNMFSTSNTLKEVPFVIKVDKACSFDSMFHNCNELTYIADMVNVHNEVSSGGNSVYRCFYYCKKLESLPKMTKIKCYKVGGFLQGCFNLRNIPDDYFSTWVAYNSGSYDNSYMFNSCYSLRNIPSSIVNVALEGSTMASYSFYQYTFTSNYVLDEIAIPVLNTKTYTSNLFGSHIDGCSRLKSYKFMTDNGVPKTANWKNQSINFHSYVGYISNKDNALTYNSGITADKEVKDDATYQALKNDPDWFTANINYSRYNHDSAVETINSLPDTSAYLATQSSSTNTIKFKGDAGSLTDGGAINTLTEEEIAVATAKGWTVTFA